MMGQIRGQWERAQLGGGGRLPTLTSQQGPVSLGGGFSAVRKHIFTNLSRISLTVIGYSALGFNAFKAKKGESLSGEHLVSESRAHKSIFGFLSNIAHHLVQPNRSQFPSKKNGRFNS